MIEKQVTKNSWFPSADSSRSLSNAHKVDLHIHSNFSDGKLSIPEIVDLYGANQYSAIAITDHLCEDQGIIGKFSQRFEISLNLTKMESYWKILKQEQHRAWQEYQMLLIPGYEITKNSFANSRSAHFLVLGIEDYICPNLPVEEILKKAKDLGGYTIAAHPFHTGEWEFQSFYLWSRREKLEFLIDAWEVNCRKKMYRELLNSELPIIANSDFHHLGHFNSWKSRFQDASSLVSLFSQVQARRLDFFLETSIN